MESQKDLLSAGNQDSLICLLMARLPNLRLLVCDEIPARSCLLRYLQKLNRLRDSQSLRRLETVVLNARSEEHHQMLALSRVFAMLPSVRDMTCSGPITRVPSHNCHAQPSYSNVTSLTIINCSGINSDIFMFLKRLIIYRDSSSMNAISFVIHSRLEQLCLAAQTRLRCSR